MINVLPLEKREDVNFEPRYVLSVSIRYDDAPYEFWDCVIECSAGIFD